MRDQAPCRTLKINFPLEVLGLGELKNVRCPIYAFKLDGIFREKSLKNYTKLVVTKRLLRLSKSLTCRLVKLFSS